MYVCRGKKTELEAWKSYLDVTDAFLALAHKPLEVSSRCVEHLERFVLIIDLRSNQQPDISQ